MASDQRAANEGRRRWPKWLGIVLAAMGSGLLALNLVGLALSMRQAPDGGAGGARAWSEIQSQLPRRPDEPTPDYCYRMNQLVHRAVTHEWSDAAAARYHLRVPVWENYWLWLAAVVDVDRFGKYEFCDWRRGLERGAGLCSQQSIVLVGILSEQNIDSQLASLGGHVVVRAEVDPQQWHILDPDYGIEIPRDLSQLEQDPQQIEPYYRAAVTRTPTSVSTTELVQIYAASNNQVFHSVRQYYPRRYWVERLAYLLKWCLPMMLWIPWIWWRSRRMAGRRSLSASGNHG